VRSKEKREAEMTNGMIGSLGKRRNLGPLRIRSISTLVLLPRPSLGSTSSRCRTRSSIWHGRSSSPVGNRRRPSSVLLRSQRCQPRRVDTRRRSLRDSAHRHRSGRVAAGGHGCRCGGRRRLLVGGRAGGAGRRLRAGGEGVGVHGVSGKTGDGGSGWDVRS
jgi:hypothetical protein